MKSSIKVAVCMLILVGLPLDHGRADTGNSAAGNSFQLVGFYDFDYFFWDVYTARLFSRDGTFSEQETRPYMLEIQYERAFTRDQLLKETQNQFRHLGIEDELLLQQWLGQLETILVNVEAGDAISLVVDENQYSLFLYNGAFLGRIEDSEFSRMFSGIWLSEKSSRPKMRKHLVNRG